MALIHKDVVWRAMTGYDLPAVGHIAAAVHPDLYEAPEVLAERQRLYRDGCYLLDIGDRAVGYLLSHPWRRDMLPALNTMLRAIPADADTYFLHDLALLPVARRIGAASHIVSAIAKHAAAEGYRTMSLVAVNGSVAFWERHGFVTDGTFELADKLASYATGTCLMVKTLTR
jgi:GNAT superfamily N-acetyltransferase